jgi:hypothetical protein
LCGANNRQHLLSLNGLGDIFVDVVGLAVTVDAHENALVGVSEGLQVLVVSSDADLDLTGESLYKEHNTVEGQQGINLLFGVVRALSEAAGNVSGGRLELRVVDQS